MELIDKIKTVEAFSELYWMDERLINFKKEIDSVYDKINNLPAVNKPDWIPCTEHLPKENKHHVSDEVLCWYEYFRYGEYNRMYQTYGIGYTVNGIWSGEVSQGVNTRVIAWTPLPEPYQEE